MKIEEYLSLQYAKHSESMSIDSEEIRAYRFYLLKRFLDLPSASKEDMLKSVDSILKEPIKDLKDFNKYVPGFNVARFNKFDADVMLAVRNYFAGAINAFTGYKEPSAQICLIDFVKLFIPEAEDKLSTQLGLSLNDSELESLTKALGIGFIDSKKRLIEIRKQKEISQDLSAKNAAVKQIIEESEGELIKELDNIFGTGNYAYEPKLNETQITDFLLEHEGIQLIRCNKGAKKANGNYVDENRRVYLDFVVRDQPNDINYRRVYMAYDPKEKVFTVTNNQGSSEKLKPHELKHYLSSGTKNELAQTTEYNSSFEDYQSIQKLKNKILQSDIFKTYKFDIVIHKQPNESDARYAKRLSIVLLARYLNELNEKLNDPNIRYQLTYKQVCEELAPLLQEVRRCSSEYELEQNRSSPKTIIFSWLNKNADKDKPDQYKPTSKAYNAANDILEKDIEPELRKYHRNSKEM
jgi:hypothetical protein